MHLLVLPISGGGFVNQLAILQHLCSIGYIPTLILSSSGGGVTAYIAAAANWKWAGIIRIARSLRPDLFAVPWSSISSLSNTIGYFEGNLCDKGSGVSDFLRQYYTDKTIVQHEIWSGTFNSTQKKARLFCNIAKKDSIIDVDAMDHQLTRSIKPMFANGDIEFIGTYLAASAAIPGVVPPQIIHGEKYVDGGIAGASPLVIMKDPIHNYITDHDDCLHITYVNSIDISSPEERKINNIVDTLKQATTDLVKSQATIDRLAGDELLRRQSGELQKDEFPCNYENMLKVKRIREKVKYTMLEIYPNKRHEINLLKFNGDEIAAAIEAGYHDCSCRLWWLKPKDSLKMENPENMNSMSDIEEVSCLIQECKRWKKMPNPKNKPEHVNNQVVIL
jgi:hypothetical protein